MADVYTHTAVFLKTPKEGVLIGQMGSFFDAHALPRIYITTERARSDSSVVSTQQTHRLLNSFKKKKTKACST